MLGVRTFLHSNFSFNGRRTHIPYWLKYLIVRMFQSAVEIPIEDINNDLKFESDHTGWFRNFNPFSNKKRKAGSKIKSESLGMIFIHQKKYCLKLEFIARVIRDFCHSSVSKYFKQT